MQANRIRNPRSCWPVFILTAALAINPMRAWAGGTDCNNNGIDDATDIANGTSTDCDGDGLLDECESDIAFRPIRSTLFPAPHNYLGAVGSDIDSDGDLDFVTRFSVFQGSSALSIQRNTFGDGPFLWEFERYYFPEAPDFTVQDTADFDGDGDMDVLILSNTVLFWVENRDGEGKRWLAHSIASVTGITVEFLLRDFNQDGAIDILIGNSNNVELRLNTNGAGVFDQVIPVMSGSAVRDFCVFDVNADGDLDVVVAGGFQLPCGWYEFDQSTLQFTSYHPIAVPFDQVDRIDAGDIDGDGDQDLVVARSSIFYYAWLRNVDGVGTFELAEDLSQYPSYVNDIKLADIDQDGDLDILVTSAPNFKSLQWRINLDGQGTFSPIVDRQAIFDISIVRLRMADMNGDGKDDIIARAAWNSDEPIIIAYATDKDCDDNGIPDACEVADGTLEDCNGNGFPDICDSEIEDCNLNNLPDSCENDCDFNGLIDDCEPPIAFHYVPISSDGGGFYGSDAGDIDGDGDLDIVATDRSLGMVNWYPNDGSGGFGAAQLVTSALGDPYKVVLIDVDEDGFVDPVVCTIENGSITWYRNLSGNGAFGAGQVIDDTYESYARLVAADFDADGDLDIAAAAHDGAVLWFENLDGAAGFGTANILDDQMMKPLALDVGDVDGDGDVDLVTADNGGFSVVWFENIDGAATFSPPRIIHDLQDGSFAVRLVDWDADGDLDVYVVTDSFPSDPTYGGQSYLMENVDGMGTVWGRRIPPVTGYQYAAGTAVADIDGDGQEDIIRANANYISYGTRFGRPGNRWALIRDTNGAIINCNSINPIDLDADGDIDLLLTSKSDGVLLAAINVFGDCNGDSIPDHCQSDLDSDGIINDCESPLGDLNCDGVVTLADVPAFSRALTDANGYAATYPGCDIELADMSDDNVIDGRDIEGFIEALVAP